MATGKSADERVVGRPLRTTLKSRRTARHRERRKPDLPGRMQPKKTASSNDPTRGGNRLDIQETILFIRDHLSKTGEELKEAVRSFPHKATLLAMVNHLIATSMGGWELREGKYVNESGHEASKKNWYLCEGGRIAPHGKKPADFDIDWLLEAREHCGQKE